MRRRRRLFEDRGDDWGDDWGDDHGEGRGATRTRRRRRLRDLVLTEALAAPVSLRASARDVRARPVALRDSD